MSTIIAFLASAALTTALNAAPVPAYGPQFSENLAGEKQAFVLPAREAPASTTTTARPGEIHAASRLTSRQNDSQYGRNYVCADRGCKTTTPAYNTKTPIDEERGRLAAD